MAKREKTWQAGPLRVRITTESSGPVKERLTRDRIVETALRLMAEQGYGAVSMRSLARALGTGPASLYAHVENRDELDQLVIDRISRYVKVPEPDPEHWAEQLKQLLRDSLAAFRAHPGSAQAALAMVPTMEGGIRSAEALLGYCLAGGIAPQAAAWFCDLATLYVSAIAAEESIWVERGRAAAASGRELSEESVVTMLRELLAGLPAELYPLLRANAGSMVSGDADQRFEFGLDLLVSGLVAVSQRYA